MEALWSALSAQDGLVWIAGAALVAGLVRGFSGFGTAMIFLPVASRFLDPFAAIAVLVLMDILGPIPNVRGALRVADRGDVIRLVLGMFAGLPVGLYVLRFVSPEVFQNGVSLLALAMVAILVMGLRYRGEVRPAMVTGTGVAGGFLGGVAGLPGPPVILFYMSRPLPSEVIRATNILYLFVYSVTLSLGLFVAGQITVQTAVLGLTLAVPNLLGNWMGGRIFVPGRERVYRTAAYVLIGASALSGLPLWG